MLGAVVENLAVDLVAHHRHLRVPLEPGDEPIEFGARHDAAGRVGRAVDDQEAGPRRDLGQHLLGAEREPGALVERHRHRRRAREADHALVDREARIGIEDLGARLAEHHDRKKHRHLAAGHDQDPVGRHLDLVAPPQIGGDGGAQGRNAVGRGIAVMAVGERLAPGLDDVVGGREIGLADPQIDDRAPLRCQRVGPRQNLEGRLGAEHRHAAGHLQHANSPLALRARNCRN